MRLSVREIELIRPGLDVVAADPFAAGRTFYSHLFARAPSLRPLFVEDMNRQAAKLASTIAALAAHAGRWVDVAPEAESLGLRPRWTRESEAAWLRLYAGLAAQMAAAR